MMRLFAVAALATLGGITGCATSSEPTPARLVVEPDGAKADMISAAVRKSMGRNDLSFEPARLAYGSELIVRPIAVEGVTDRVPGTPTRLVLMMDKTSCWLSGPEDMRIDLPDMACRAER